MVGISAWPAWVFDQHR